MLRRGSQQNGQQNSTIQKIHKQFDAALKHKIRNLRAKLKTLLSTDLCCKYNKRQKIVKNIAQNEFIQFFTTKHGWNHTKQNPKQFYCSDNRHKNYMNIFMKLKQEQIQQIKEDKIYYLGEQNTDKFEEFLKMKEREKHLSVLQINCQLKPLRRVKKLKTDAFATERNQQNIKFQPNQTQIQIIKNPFHQFRKSLQEPFSQIQTQILKPKIVKRLKTTNFDESRISSMTKKSSDTNQTQISGQRKLCSSKPSFNSILNRQNFLKKRRMLQQQEQAQKIIIRLNYEMKQQKASTLYTKNQLVMQMQIKDKNIQNDEKTNKIKKQKQKKNVHFGEIVQLNEELRKVFIKKISSMT